ncbi:MAG: preprotein translocase subunit SecY [Ruminococcaceae bacterium]|nr:preprotein translocase subunit SecY [Oscillospiraceae bacterium]
MFETIKNAWKIVDLRKKILFTLFILLIFRIGSVITVPFVDPNELQSGVNQTLGMLATLTGGALEYGTLFALGVAPYINSSIILQLLCVAIPALERLSKEGEEGRKKIAQLTRYITIVLAMIQGTAYYIYMAANRMLTVSTTGAKWFAGFVVVLSLTAGSALVMWLGEQIDEKGIGNGISMILFAGIISRADNALETLIAWFKIPGAQYKVAVIAIVVVFLLVIAFIVWMSNAERRLPVQYAKRVVGRKMYGGQNTHLPIKVNMSGVMPIIFASSILMLPTMIRSFAPNAKGWFFKVLDLFTTQGSMYAVIYFAMIIAFAYFYTTIQYNPVEMANNLRKNSGSIPGLRPGKPTADFIKKVLSRITLIGALLLSVIAVGPIFFSMISPVFSTVSIGGTSVIIIVGVALDIVNNLESQMMMRHYKGFLD